jgi:hypothetical protein
MALSPAGIMHLAQQLDVSGPACGLALLPLGEMVIVDFCQR